MARRKRKKEPKADLLTGSLVLFTVITFYFTNSIPVTIVAGSVLFGIILIVLTLIRWQKQQRIKKSGIHEVDKMTGLQFEEYLRLLFLDSGYRVRETPKSGDYGVDLLLDKDGRRIAVQAKRYKNTVGIKAVQEVSAAKLHYKAQETWVVTNSHFTRAAEILAASNDVRLVGREQLFEMSLRIQSAQSKEVSTSQAKA